MALHLGLCLLVVGYSIMGAVIFVALEREHELEIKETVRNMKSVTLNELYDLTGKQNILQNKIINFFVFRNKS